MRALSANRSIYHVYQGLNVILFPQIRKSLASKKRKQRLLLLQAWRATAWEHGLAGIVAFDEQRKLKFTF